MFYNIIVIQYHEALGLETNYSVHKVLKEMKSYYGKKNTF